jgi:glycosyltransferase involved in cell wall biosynthesis
VRILVASGTWSPEQNGVSRVATETARALAERGHHVTALVPRLGAAEPAEEESPVHVQRALERGRLPLTLTDVVQTKRHARSLTSSYDVLLAHGSMVAAGLARARLPAPLAFVYHASLRRELRFLRSRMRWSRGRLVAYANGPIAAMSEREAVNRAAVTLVLSDFSRSLLEADHPGRLANVRLVSGGVDTASFHPGDGAAAARTRLGLDPSRRLLVTARRAEPRMGLEELLHAAALLDQADVDLVVAGGGPFESDLLRLVGELDLHGRVRILGRLTEDQLRDLYRAGDLFVLPTIAYEGFGMVTVEALASGTPVVGTPVGATPELLEPLDPRLVATGSDAAALAAAIRTALDFVDGAFRARCRDYALRRFDWREAIGGWESVLADAATQRGGAPLATMTK